MNSWMSLKQMISKETLKTNVQVMNLTLLMFHFRIVHYKKILMSKSRALFIKLTAMKMMS